MRFKKIQHENFSIIEIYKLGELTKSSIVPITKDIVHIWMVNLNNLKTQFNMLEKFLSRKEIKKMNNFYFQGDKNRFVVGHGLLRMLLGAYLNIYPKDLKIRETLYGKLFLDIGQNIKKISFNISHSEDLVVLGFSTYKSIGIDIEYIRNIPELDEIVKNFFHPKEIGLFNKLDLESKEKSFFKLWTKKEAFIKATGEGLTRSLNTFNITKDNKLEIEDRIKTNDWKVLDVDLPKGYVGTVIVEK